MHHKLFGGRNLPEPIGGTYSTLKTPLDVGPKREGKGWNIKEGEKRKKKKKDSEENGDKE